MKDKLAEKLKETLIKIGNKSHIDLSDIRIEIKENKDKDFGDFSSNAAMVCAKKLSLTPIDLAKDVIENLKGIEGIEKLEIAGPGFINIFPLYGIPYGLTLFLYTIAVLVCFTKQSTSYPGGFNFSITITGPNLKIE